MSEQAAKKNNIQGSKLIQLLGVLSPLELKRFKKFLESPFHNSSGLLVQLYGLLKKYHPTYDTPQLTKEKLFAKLFGKKDYQPKRMSDLMYDLRRLVEDFLIVSDTLDKKESRLSALVKVLGKRNHYFFREESAKLIHEITTKKTYLVGEDYLKLQQIYDRLWFHIDTEKKSNVALSFEKANENLDAFYLMMKLQYIGEQESRKKIYKVKESLKYKSQLITFINNHIELKQEPLFSILEQVILLTEDKLNINEFYKLKGYIFSHADKVEKNLLRDFLTHLMNYCIHNSNRGAEILLEDLLELYKFSINYQLLLINGRIRKEEYLNISLLAYRLGYEEWSDKFSDNYAKYLNPVNAEDLINLVGAYKHFYKKDYRKADELINSISFKNKNYYYPKIKVQIIRGLYEDWVIYKNNNAEAILNHSIAYEQWIKRNVKYSTEKNRGYLNFIRFLKRLVQLKRNSKFELNNFMELRMEIEQNMLVTYRTWLLEKIADCL